MSAMAFEPKANKKPLGTAGIIVILVGATIAGIVGKELGNKVVPPRDRSSRPANSELQRGLQIAARELNNRTPLMLDANTRLDRARVSGNNRIIYDYTLVNHQARAISGDWLRANLFPVVATNTGSLTSRPDQRSRHPSLWPG